VGAPVFVVANFRRFGLIARDKAAVASPSAEPRSALRVFFAAAASSLVALALFLTLPAPAGAVVSGHTYAYSLGNGPGLGNGQFTSTYGSVFGMGMAVDQATGDIYVTDPEGARIEKFDASGAFLQAWGFGVVNGANESQVCSAPSICQSGIAGGAPGQFDHPTSIAIDNSGGESDGDVYVADTGTPTGGAARYVHKFTRNGIYLGRIDGDETPGGLFTSLTWQGAIGVDGNGYLWVADGTRILKYTGELENEYVGGSEFSFLPVSTFAVNSAGTRLSILRDYGGLFRTSANGFSKEELWPGPGGNPYEFGENPWIGVDPVTEDTFVAYGDQVREYGTNRQPVAPNFGPGVLTAGLNGAVAFDEHTRIVYVADPATAKVFAFAPRIIPDVATEPAPDVSAVGATLKGLVAPDPAGGGNVVDCHFDFGTDTSYGTTIPCDQATPYATQTAVSAAVSGLTPETTYHYRVVASNSVDANAGADMTFTTHAVRGLSTDPATEVTPNGATLNGSFDPAGADTHYYFEWGATTSYENVTVAPPGVEVKASSGTVHVSAPIDGLSTNTKYHYRIVASNNIGTSYGEDMVVATDPPPIPIVAETAAHAVTDRGATLEASVNPNFGETFYSFEYGRASSYGDETPLTGPIGPDGKLHPVGADLSGLFPGTTYHYRVVALNFGGTVHGPDRTFTTQSEPKIESTEVLAVAQTTAEVGARVNAGLSETSYRFEYGTSIVYGASTPEAKLTGLSDVAQAARTSLSGLQPGTTYHIRAVAINAIGTAYGSDKTFTTASSGPSEQAKPPNRCRKGFVKKHGKCVKRRKAKRRHSNGGRNHG
jgi:hypothetical protein